MMFMTSHAGKATTKVVKPCASCTDKQTKKINNNKKIIQQQMSKNESTKTSGFAYMST